MKTFLISKWLVVLLMLSVFAASAQVNLTIGNLAPGEVVTLTFDVTLTNPFPAGVTTVTNQGTISGSSFSPLNTDDPQTAPVGDATVTAVGVPPLLSSFAKTVNEDTTLSFTYLDFKTAFSDANSDTLTNVQITALPANGVLKLSGVNVTLNQNISTNNLGNLTFIGTANFFGSTTFSWKGTDSTGLPSDSAATVTVNVTAVADTPSVTGATTSEDTMTSSGLVVSRNPADGAEVTNFKITSITGGTLFLNDGTTVINNSTYLTFAQANAGLRFLPATNANTLAGNSFSFGVQASTSASDAGLGGSVVTATITVTEVNDPPTAANDTLTDVAEDSGQRSIPFTTLLANDSTGPANESAQTLTIIGVGNAVGGTVGISGNNVLFTPAANFYGPASFSYTNQDNGTTAGANDFKTSFATVNFNVTAVADTPSVTSASTQEGQQTTNGLVISRNASDGAEVTHFKISNVQHGTVYLNDGTTAITTGTFITFAQGNAGLKFTPSAGLYSPTNTFSFDVQASTNNAAVGLGGGTVTATITVNPYYDFGDAPAPYPTLLSEDGARHVVLSTGATLYLGTAPSAEADALRNATATGDSHEDGVVLPAAFVAGTSSNITVTANAPGVLNAWVDFNADGDWNDAGEQICTNVALVAGPNVLAITPPLLGTSTNSFARFRFSSQANLAPTGAAPDGEVEDYSVNLVAAAPPNLTCPADIFTTNALGQCVSGPVSFTAVSGGIPAPTVSYKLGATTITSPYVFPLGTNLVTVTATNVVGPDATCSFLVIINDAENPAINCPADVLVLVEAGQTQATVNYTVTAIDNCGVPGLISSPASGLSFPVGTTVVHSVATDAAGNSNSCSFQIVVQAKSLPAVTWTNPAAIVYSTALSATQLNASANVPGAFVYNPPAGTVLDAGDHTLLAAFTPTDTTNYSSTTNSVLLTVTKAGTTADLSASASVSLPAQPVVFTFTLSTVPPGLGPPSGNVQFQFHGTNAPSLTPLSGGAASYTNSSLVHGSNSVVAEYAGDTNFSGVTNTLPLPVLINTPPTNGTYMLSVSENTSATVSATKLANGIPDPDLDVLSLVFVSTSSTNGGTIAFSAGSYTYTPVTNYFGADSFTFAVQDGYSPLIATNTVAITIRSNSASTTLRTENVVPPSGGDTNATVYGSGRPLATYNVQRSTDLSTWLVIGSTNALANGLIIFVDTNPPVVTAYYRFAKP